MSLKSVDSKFRPLKRVAEIQQAYLERLLSEKLGLHLEKWFKNIRRNPSPSQEIEKDDRSQ